MKKTHVNSNVNLNTLAGGAFAEKVNEALVQVGENIQNQNTEATKKRKITITMTFAPNKTRQLVNTQIGVTTTLAATEAVDTQMVMGMNMRTGQLEIGEYDGQIRGQMSINEILCHQGKRWRGHTVHKSTFKGGHKGQQKNNLLAIHHRSRCWKECKLWCGVQCG